MAASPRTQKAAGSAKKAAGAKRKTAAGSAQKAGQQKTPAGPARKPASSKRTTASGSAQKASGTKQKTAAGSARKAGTASNRSATNSKTKPTGSRQRAGTGSQGRTTNSKPQRRTASAKPKKGIYVYAVLPADVELTSEMPGVGDPAGQVRVIRSDGLAALVSDVDVARPLGSPDDLVAHEQIVDATAAAVPVLPARFGAVLASEEAVAEELLAANHDEFDEALNELEGRAQYVVKGRYDEKEILAEILSENRQAARMAGKLRGGDPDATRDARIKLGEIINAAVAAKRHRDTQAVGHAMEGHCVASLVREPTHELDAVHVAFLVDTDEEGEVGQVIEDLAHDWEGRIEMRLLGPMAAYDFVGSVVTEG